MNGSCGCASFRLRRVPNRGSGLGRQCPLSAGRTSPFATCSNIVAGGTRSDLSTRCSIRRSSSRHWAADIPRPVCHPGKWPRKHKRPGARGFPGGRELPGGSDEVVFRDRNSKSQGIRVKIRPLDPAGNPWRRTRLAGRKGKPRTVAFSGY